jgi:heme A synthase
MSDLDTQIRSYFDANVERVTADDVLAGRRLVEQLHRPSAGWQVSPRFAVAFGFGVTVFVVAGSLGLGLALRQSSDNAASGTVSYAVGAGTSTSTGWSLLGISAVLAVVALILVVLALRSARSRSSTKGEETAMSTTFETPPVDHKLEVAHRTNRWLVAAVVVLAIAVVALGAWVVNDLTATAATEVPAEITTLVDSYTGTWNEYDGDAFLGYVREMDYVHSSYSGTFNAAETAGIIDGWEAYGHQTEVTGDNVIVGDGTTKWVVQPNRITSNANPDGVVGFSVFTVNDWSDDGWVVTRHVYIGERLQ